MPRFFIRANQIEDGVVTLLGDDAHHISRSLRMAAGECITVCDMQKNEYECQLTDFLPDRVLAKILDKAMGGIRVEESEEIGGLDTNLHEESAYNLN